MGLYKDRLGLVVEADDAFAQGQGFTPYSAGEQVHDLQNEAVTELGEARGWMGDASAGLTGLASGLTLGLSDSVVASGLTGSERRRLSAEINANQNWRTAGEITGAVAGAFLGAGPSGFLSNASSRVAEAGLARGGLLGTAKAIGAYGVEGAIQNAGQYIGLSAIHDRDITAEGLSGALGTGFAFSGGASGAMLGITKGTIAARRLWSKAMDGGEDATLLATQKWEQQADAIMRADSDTLKAAKQELADIDAAEMQALSVKMQQNATLKAERAYAARAAGEVPVAPGVVDDALPPVAGLADDAVTPTMAGGEDTLGLSTRKQQLNEAIQEYEAAQGSILERQLLATKQGLDDGASIRDLNARRADEAYELYNKQIDDAHDKIKNAGDDFERQAAVDELTELEARGFNGATNDDLVGDVAKHAEGITKYESASAKLADAVGDSAHPLSKEAAEAYRAAEGDATESMLNRTTREIEDTGTFGPFEEVGPTKLSSKERVQYAKQRYAEADADVAAIKAKKFEAKQTVKRAEADNTARIQAAEQVSFGGKSSTGGQGGQTGLGRAADAGAIYETLSMAGVVPSANAIPIIGPLLGTYLKYRAAKSLVGRFTGRVPATGEAKAAAFAAQTKERVAKAVDRMLGVVERTTPKLVQPTAIIGAALSRRIYDDGEPDAKEKDSIGKKTAVRVRELSSYVNTPGAIERDVRKEMRGVTDPALIEAVEKHRRLAYEYLLKTAPKAPPNDPLSKKEWQPSPAEATSFGRRVAVVNDPAAALEAVQHLQVTLDHAETLKNVYPKLFAAAQERLMQQATKIQASVPYKTQAQAALLFDIPLHSSLQPDNMRVLQSAYQDSNAAPASPQGPVPAQPPAPSIAGGANLTPLYQTSADRSALRR